MVRDAFRFLIPLLLLFVLFLAYDLVVPALLCLALGAFVGFFFRNPRRDIPGGEKLVVSPADGKVVRVSKLDTHAGQPGGHSVSIFLSVFNVHVNRAPIGGRLAGLEYRRGRFKAAFDDEASRINEQNILTIRGQEIEVVVKQIAGLIARRVVCWKHEGDAVGRGELFGLIRFGSRVDVHLPERVRLRVKPGDRVQGGTSILAEYG